MSEQVTTPKNFLVVGQRVRALRDIYDLPGNDYESPLRAVAGDEGECVHVEPNFYPTVKFFNTGGITVVTPEEVETI